jgi:hypothetical protein
MRDGYETPTHTIIGPSTQPKKLGFIILSWLCRLRFYSFRHACKINHRSTCHDTQSQHKSQIVKDCHNRTHHLRESILKCISYTTTVLASRT